MTRTSRTLAIAAVILSIAVARLEGAARMPAAHREASTVVHDAGVAVPIVFEENVGQADSRGRFVVRPRGLTALIRDAGLTVAAAPVPSVDPVGRRDATRPALDEPADLLRLELVGADAGAHVQGTGRLHSVSNYLRGSEPSMWLRHVPHWRGAVTPDVLDGVDLIWRASAARSLAFDLRLRAGRDASDVRLRVAASGTVRLSAAGELEVPGAHGLWQLSRPVAYQERVGGRDLVACEFVTRDDGLVSFRLGVCDPRRDVVIDPELRYSTYLGGGGGSDYARGVAVDDDGDVYVVGTASSTSFPTQNAYDGSHDGGSDVFVSKLGADGASLEYSTFLGGSGNDFGFGVALGPSGGVHVCGYTKSMDFPTASAYDSTFNGGGGGDGFVAKLSEDGSALEFSTYIGGNASDQFHAIAVDSSGDVYVAGGADSTYGYPLQSALQTTQAGDYDGCVTKLSSDGSSVLYSTFLGGSGFDFIEVLVVDSSGALYFGATSDSADFPVQSAEQGTSAGGDDAVVGKLNAAGSALVFSTYLGGTANETLHGLAVDGSGSVYVTGFTASSDFPVSTSALQTGYGGGTRDVFLTKFSSDASSHVFSTYFGGSGDEIGEGLLVTSLGVVCVVGQTTSSNLPVQAPLQGSFGGSTDGFVAAFASSGQSLLFSTYLGGSGDDRLFDVARSARGLLHVCGLSDSSGLATSGAYQTSPAGGDRDVLLLALETPEPPSAPEGLAVEDASDVHAVISWADMDDLESGFEIERGEGAGAFAALVTVAEDSTSYSDSTPSPRTAYRYRVRTVNDHGVSEWSNVATVTTTSPPPTGVGAESPTNRSVTISWSDDADDEVGYVVERALGCPGVGWSTIATLPANSTSITNGSVLPETEYSYRVRTAGSEWISSPSLEACVTTGPADPSSLLAIAQSDSAVLLRWSDNSTIESGYEIQRTPDGGQAQIVTTASANASELLDDSVAAETAYSYRVRAVAAQGESGWSLPASTRTAPMSPSEPFGEAVSSSRLRLSWTDNSRVESGFEVRRRIHGAETPLELVGRLPSNTTSFTDVGLLQETAYDYTVNAYDGSGASNPVAIDELATTAVLVVERIKTKAAKGKKPSSMTVQAAIDFGGYVPDPAAGTTIRIGEAVFPISALTAKGKSLRGATDGASFKLSPAPPASSRGKLTLTITGTAAEVEPGASLTIAIATGDFHAAGTLQLDAQRGFDLKKHRGTRIDPDIVPTKLKLSLGGLELDKLTLSMSFEAPRAVPDVIENALVTVGDVRLVFPGATAHVDGDKVTYAIDATVRAVLTVDYAKGTISVGKTKGLELGEYPPGDVPTLLDVVVGDLHWRDVPVLHSTGKRATY